MEAPIVQPRSDARSMSDADVRAAVNADLFSNAVYLRDHPDVAADPYWSQNPERHYLAHGIAAGWRYPLPDVQIKTVYEVPALPSTAGLFPKVTQVAPAPASSPVQATPVPTPLQQTSMFATPVTSYAPQIGPAPAPAPLPAKSLPSWVIPAAIGAAALVAVPILMRKKGSRHAP
jgi:hypothetical protein